MRPFRLLTGAMFTAATLPRLMHRGMFVDGITYASIARNLADGRGSFWNPFYTATLYPEFHQHPPLGFWLQSWWFRLLGDHLAVERVYSLTVAVLTALLVGVIWRRLRQTTSTESNAWLPVALWILVPVVSWSIVGNMLETTVSLFTTAAVAAFLQSTSVTTRTETFGWAAVAGGGIVAATLTKGPIGLFPLAAPIIFLHVCRDKRRAWLSFAVQCLVVLLCFALAFSLPTSRASLTKYVSDQLVPALGRAEGSAPPSFKIIGFLFGSVWLPIAAACGLLLAIARGGGSPARDDWRRAAALVGLALAGTLPITISAKQMGHYLVPAVPFSALAAAMLIGPRVQRIAHRMNEPRRAAPVYVLSGLLLTSSVVAAFHPALEREPDRLTALDHLTMLVPRDSVIGICAESAGDWGLHAWFERLFLVSLDARQSDQHGWFLGTNPPSTNCPPPSCVPVSDQTLDLVLLRCNQ